MKSVDASQSPDLEGGDDCFQKDGDDTLLDQAIAGSMYLDEEQLAKLRSLVEKYRDIWRVSLTDDGPEKVKPLKVHLKSDAVPRRARARKYAPKYWDWMIKHVKMLKKNGFLRKNPRGILFLDGTWCVYTNTVDPGKY